MLSLCLVAYNSHMNSLQYVNAERSFVCGLSLLGKFTSSFPLNTYRFQFFCHNDFERSFYYLTLFKLKVDW